MPTARTPRVQITLKPATRAIFLRLSAAQDRPEATIIAEFLDETAPALQNVVAVVERAKNIVSKVGQQERERFAIAEAELLQHTHTALSALAGVDASMMQLDFDLNQAAPGTSQRHAAGGRGTGSARPNPDPPDTNRGVNTKRRSNGTRSKT